jgi:hypothetical protein
MEDPQGKYVMINSMIEKKKYLNYKEVHSSNTVEIVGAHLGAFQCKSKRRMKVYFCLKMSTQLL